MRNKNVKLVLVTILLIAVMVISLIVTVGNKRCGTRASKVKSSTIVWNGSRLVDSPLSESDIQGHKARFAPITERATSSARIARVLNKKHIPADLADSLIPLRAWIIPIGTISPERFPKGNVFMARYTERSHAVQIVEGLGFVVVQIRKTDGSRLAEPLADLSEYARESAGEWLCDTMIPGKDALRIGNTKAPHVYRWITADKPDASGLEYQICHVYTDGYYLKYEIIGYIGNLQFIAAPEPYTFIDSIHNK